LPSSGSGPASVASDSLSLPELKGHAKETIDAAAQRFGMPMGPIELSDFVGLDICADTADSLRRQLDRPLPAPPGWLREQDRARRAQQEVRRELVAGATARSGSRAMPGRRHQTWSIA